MVFYDIKFIDKNRLFEWLQEQPNQITPPFKGNKNIVCEFNHTPTQQTEFKKSLISQMFLIDDASAMVSLLKYMKELQSDQLVFITESNQNKTNIGTSYVNIFPASINGNPIPISTEGFTKLGIQLFWNKNAGTSNHDFRIVNDNNINQVIYEKTNITTTITEDFNVNIKNTPFEDFIGKLRIQGKAGNGTDSPTFLGLRLYLRR